MAVLPSSSDVRLPASPKRHAFFFALPDGEVCPAKIQDLTARGVSLLCQGPLAPKVMVRLFLFAGDRFICQQTARVVRTTRLGANQCLLGCAFARELREEELQEWQERETVLPQGGP